MRETGAAVTRLPEIAQVMLNPGIYPDSPARVELIQTQMSFVFLAGKYAYKVKKPVNLGYLDYTTLEKRHLFCLEEVRLNRRLCPEVYLGVVSITCNNSSIALEGDGEVLDYAVKMINLPRDRMLDVLLDRSHATPEILERIARKLSDFHAQAEASPAIAAFGAIDSIRINTDENFVQTVKFIGRTIPAREFRAIQNYTSTFLQTQAALFDERVAGGRIRDCHGDLHARNICVTDGICIYDCIEFNARMRYGDVASDIAFLAMDLDHYGRADLSRCFINTYVEASRDVRIRDVFKFYKCYRAYVRGKVESFKVDDRYISEIERKNAAASARSYFDLAYSYSCLRPRLFITTGLIGSGKSTLSRSLARRLGLTVLSSDIIRKQLAGIPAGEHRFEPVDQGIYSADFSRWTYDKLFAEARNILRQGESVILDASFIQEEDRVKARQLAEETGADFFILETVLDEASTQQRLAQRLRHASVSDGRWELYKPQKSKFEPVAEKHFIIDSAQPLDEQITRIIEKI